MTASEDREEGRTPLDEAMDLFVYAPIGMALTAAEELPEMIRKGREAVEVQMGTAKVIGRVAVNQGKVELNRIVAQWNDLGSLLRSGVVSPPRSRTESGPAPVTSAEPAPPPVNPSSADKPRGAQKPPSPAPVPPAAKRVPPPPDDLGIPGYGSLSASQVVSRLAGLSPAQLDAVKTYESSTRRRRTILGRIAQLQGNTKA